MKKIKEQFSKIIISTDFLARVFIGVLFIYSGVEKIIYFSDTSDFLFKYLIPNQGLSDFLLIIALLLEIILGIGLILGRYKRDLIIKSLIVYTLALTIVIDYNYFGGVNTFFLKNIAIVGGLMALIGQSKTEQYSIK